MKNYMIGTRFYRFIDDVFIEEIRLKNLINKDGTILASTGYRDVFFTPEEFTVLYKSGHLIKKDENTFMYTYDDVNGNPFTQIWKLVYSGKEFIKFRLENKGIYVSEDDLDKYYIRLVPDGFLIIGILKYSIAPGKACKDVVICFNKYKDRGPCIICRQDISNPYNKDIVGASISLKKFPHIDPDSILYGDLIHVKNVAIYAEDTISTILHYVSPVNKYNQVLSKMYDNASNKYMGLNKNIYELLCNTSFYADFADLFGIGLYPMDLSLDRSEMGLRETTMFNCLYSNGKKYDNLKYKPYSREYDLSDMNMFPIRIANMDGGSKLGDLFVVY